MYTVSTILTQYSICCVHCYHLHFSLMTFICLIRQTSTYTHSIYPCASRLQPAHTVSASLTLRMMLFMVAVCYSQWKCHSYHAACFALDPMGKVYTITNSYTACVRKAVLPQGHMLCLKKTTNSCCALKWFFKTADVQRPQTFKRYCTKYVQFI